MIGPVCALEETLKTLEIFPQDSPRLAFISSNACKIS